MGKNSGTLVTYQDENNVTKTGIIFPRYQYDAFRKHGKVLIHLCDENNNLLQDCNGNKVVALKDKKIVTAIGFID